MNITINQITNQQETVPNTVLTKILTVKRNGGVVNLTGNIYIPAAYVNEVLEFCTYFGLTEDENTPGTYRGNDIILSVGTNYISFEDSNAEKVCAVFFGNGEYVTENQMANAIFGDNNKHDITINGQTLTNVTFEEAFAKASIVNFTEFKYFTGIRTLGGYSSSTYKYYGLSNNPTLAKITLPPYLTELTPDGNMFGTTGLITITNATQITYLSRWSHQGFGKNYFDFTKIRGDYSASGFNLGIIYRALNDVIVMPETSVASWDSNKSVRAVALYATKILFPSTFQCGTLNFNSTSANDRNSIVDAVFLSVTQPWTSITTWAMRDGFKIYVPDSATAAYTDVQSPGTLSQFANMSDENKELLESCGCTATGSTGNWTILAPGEQSL